MGHHCEQVVMNIHKLRHVIKQVINSIVKLQTLAIHPGWRQHLTSRSDTSFVSHPPSPLARNTGNKPRRKWSPDVETSQSADDGAIRDNLLEALIVDAKS